MGLKNLARMWSGLVLAATVTLTARADDEVPPVIQSLPCVKVCANSTGPVPLRHPGPPFPKDNLWYGTYVEGYVTLHLSITSEGRVSDIIVLELVGPQNFLDTTLETVKDWTYKPATVEGKPVAAGQTVTIDFRVPKSVPYGRTEIVRLYDQALQQIKDSRLDDAMATLGQGQAMERLNFYERGMLANLASMILMSKGDYLEAYRLAKMATVHGARTVKPAIVQNLFETRIKASLMLGDIIDAQKSLAFLKTKRGFDPEAPIAKLVEEARANADSKPAFGTMARIPEGGDKGAAAYIGLYRRHFGFTNISGSLDRFILNCKQQSIESKITTTAEWHVPKNWSDCYVLVRGAPGTTFQLAQAID